MDIFLGFFDVSLMFSKLILASEKDLCLNFKVSGRTEFLLSN